MAALAGPRLVLPLLDTAGTSAYGKLSMVLEVTTVSDAETHFTARLLGDGGGSSLSLLVEITDLGLFPLSILREMAPAHTGQRLLFSPRDGPPGDRLRIVGVDPAKTTSRNRVLRGAGATPAAKRTQGACRPRD